MGKTYRSNSDDSGWKKEKRRLRRKNKTKLNKEFGGKPYDRGAKGVEEDAPAPTDDFEKFNFRKKK